MPKPKPRKPVVVVDYDPMWPDQFSLIAASLTLALANVPLVGIEHVGSTSVPGLSSKPIIDIDIVVEREHVSAAHDALIARGYVSKGKSEVPDRDPFGPPPASTPPKQNLYVCVAGTLPVRNHLAVRDTLRANTALRDEYTATKQALVKDTTTLYFKGKRALVMRIIEVSGRFTPKEMEALGVQDLTRTARKVKKVKKRVEEVKAEEAEVEEEKDTIAAEKHDATDPNDTVEEKGAINVGGATEPNDGADPKATVPDEIVLVVSAVEVKTISDPCSCEPNDPPEAEDAPFSKIATGAPDAN